ELRRRRRVVDRAAPLRAHALAGRRADAEAEPRDRFALGRDRDALAVGVEHARRLHARDVGAVFDRRRAEDLAGALEGDLEVDVVLARALNGTGAADLSLDLVQLLSEHAPPPTIGPHVRVTEGTPLPARGYVKLAAPETRDHAAMRRCSRTLPATARSGASRS